MEKKWCWRCKIKVPMLNQKELQLCIEARKKGKEFVVKEIKKRNIKDFE